MKQGFTLIELLIVVAIIGILAAIAVPNFMNAQVRAKVTRSMSEFRTMSDAYQLYKMDYNNFPPILGLIPDWQGRTTSHAFRPLTTPISYYSGSIQDLFQPAVNRKEPLFDLYDGSYAYSAPVPTDDTISRFGYLIQTYSLLSFGPDQLPTIYNTSRFPDFYSPSNGIISGGDIIFSESEGLHNYGN